MQVLLTAFFLCPNRLGKESEYREVLASEGQEKLILALTSLQAVCGELKEALINIKTLELIRQHSQRFLHLCRILKFEGMEALTGKRFAELNAFEDERDKLTRFSSICSRLRRGTHCSFFLLRLRAFLSVQRLPSIHPSPSILVRQKIQVCVKRTVLNKMLVL